MNTSVSFPIAKLLKEKGFDKDVNGAYVDTTPFSEKEDDFVVYSYPQNHNKLEHRYSSPTIAEVCIWLYEKHGIWIEVHGWTNQPVGDEIWKNCFQAFVSGDAMNVSMFKTPTEAYLTAIEYTIKNLI